MNLNPDRVPDLRRSEIAACVDAASAALGLPVAAGHRDGVLDAFAEAAACAARLDAAALRIDDPPALVFTPLGPGDAPLPDRRRR